MSYADSLLSPGERIVRRGGQHPLIIVRRTIWALLALAVAALILYVRATVQGSSPVLGLLGYVTLGLVALGVLSIAWSALTFRSEEIVLTNRRIVRARGVINKRATDAALDRIADAVLTEPVFGRVFGYGDLDIRTAGVAGIGRLRMLRGAKGFKTAVLDARHELGLELARPTSPPLRASPAVASFPVPPSAAATSVPPDAVVAELHRLAERRAAGEIDQADFDRRRGELLARL